jgi:hypothetical protein
MRLGGTSAGLGLVAKRKILRPYRELKPGLEKQYLILDNPSLVRFLIVKV